MAEPEYYMRGGGGAASYYLDGVTDGEPPGVWSGGLAAKLGLSGVVDESAMTDLFGEGLAPDGSRVGSPQRHQPPLEQRVAARLAKEPQATAERRREIQVQEERRNSSGGAGWDATFAVFKDVSLAEVAFHRMELSARRAGNISEAERWKQFRALMHAAVDEGNRAGLEFLERNLVVRAGPRGAEYFLKVTGLAVATFAQADNRDGDPHQHRHNVTYNRALCEDGEIRAIEGTTFLALRAEASAVADRALVDFLARFGLRLELSADGTTRRWAGVDTKLLAREYSSRRKAITGALAEAVAQQEAAWGRPLSPAEVRILDNAMYSKTRKAKSHEARNTTEQVDLWSARAEQVGEPLELMAQTLARVVDRRLAEEQAGLVVDEAAAFDARAVCEEAVADLASRKATWERGELAVEIEKRLPPGVTRDTGHVAPLVGSLTDWALAASNGIVQPVTRRLRPLPAGVDDGRQRIRATDGRYAAVGTLAAEEELRRAARGASGHALDTAALAAWIDANANMIGADQRAAVLGLACSRAELSLLSAPAGTGKSYAIARLSEAWSQMSGGGRVHGLALASVARDVLAADGLPVVANLARWLDAQQRITAGHPTKSDLPFAVDERDLVVIDEASMADTAKVLAVLEAVRRSGARLVLAGDARQLAAVDAGGVLPLLDGHAATYGLTDVRRMREDWEKEASLRLREGDLSVLGEYEARGRIAEADTLAEAGARAAHAVAADILADRTSMVLTDTNHHAAELAALVRAELVAAGFLPDVPAAELVSLAAGGHAGVGDLIQARQNDNVLGLVNRHQYRVVAVNPDKSMRVQVIGHPEVKINLSASYAASSVALAYAGTVHAAEGLTFTGSAHNVVGPDTAMSAAGAYVANTRAKDGNYFWVARHSEAGPDLPAPDREPVSGRAVLETVLERRPDADTAATVLAEQAQAEDASAATVLAQLELLAGRGALVRLDQQLDDLAAAGALSQAARDRVAGEDGRERLAALLRLAEQAGQDPGELLVRAARSGGRGGGLDDVGNVTAVLTSRIENATRLFDPAARRPPTTDGPPAGLDAEYDAEFADLAARYEARGRVLAEQQAQEPQPWAVEAFGPVPGDEDGRATWVEQAAPVCAYREASGYEASHRAVDHVPGMQRTEQTAMWWRAQQALGVNDPADAVMSPERLRTRVAAWEHALAEAPPHVAEALRHTEQTIAAETVEARHAAHRRDDEAAKLHSKHASEAAKDRPALTAGHEQRREWLAEYAVLAEEAASARTELERRHEAVERPQPAITGEQWLAHERAARTEDDAHRDVDRLTDAEEVPAARVDHVAQIGAYKAELDATRRGLLLGADLPAQPSRVELDALEATASYAAQQAEHRAARDARAEAGRWLISEADVYEVEHDTASVKDAGSAVLDRAGPGA